MKALITGASSGIGLDMARYLSTKKWELILVARNKEKLEEIQEQLPTKVTIIVADLSNEQRVKDLYVIAKKENVENCYKECERVFSIVEQINKNFNDEFYDIKVFPFYRNKSKYCYKWWAFTRSNY